MVGRSFGMVAAALLAVMGVVHCTSAQTEPSASRRDTVTVAQRADSEVTSKSAAAPSGKTRTSKAKSAPTSSPSKPPRTSASTNGATETAAAPPSSLDDAIAVPSEPVGPNPETLDERGRAALEIEQTDRELASIRGKAERSTNRKARQDFQTAMQRQAEARESLEESFFARASRLTLEAREMARQIAIHLGPPEEDPDFVSMTLDRTDDALGRAKEIIERGGGPAEQRRMKALESDQKEARSLFKDGDTRASYEATRTIRDGVLTLLRQCDELPVSPSTAERALKRAARALELAEPELGDRVNPTVRRLVRDAREQMAKARVSFARKNYRDTLLHSKLVERKLELAIAAQRSATSRSG